MCHNLAKATRQIRRLKLGQNQGSRPSHHSKTQGIETCNGVGHSEQRPVTPSFRKQDVKAFVQWNVLTKAAKVQAPSIHSHTAAKWHTQLHRSSACQVTEYPGQRQVL